MRVEELNKYHKVQISCLGGILTALFWQYCLPQYLFDASIGVDIILSILQAILVPNVFLSLTCAIILLEAKLLRKLASGFVKLIGSLWLLVSLVLLGFWLVLFDASHTQIVAPVVIGNAGITALLPLMIGLAVLMGYLFTQVERLEPYQAMLHQIQIKVSRLFELVYVLVPFLVFFVVLNFIQNAEFERIWWTLNYIGLSVVFVTTFITLLLPLCYRYFLQVPYWGYWSMILPVALLTFVAGDSLAAVPLIAKAADEFGDHSDMRLATIITMVVICFPWLGELANLIFPIYSAAVEAYPLHIVLKMLMVGPFFMFTDPLISVPVMLKTFAFPEVYQSAYLTMAIFTDHMFEMSESIAVLLVCARLKMLVAQDSAAPTHSEV
jgi:Na+/H+-dicarboxylate symporter